MPIIDAVSLNDVTRSRYLNYALSVISSRALPDIRDGLKPVQRRILYAMFANLRLTPDGRYRKSASVVGEVMGKYHPHGDSAIYDAMVRMAQDFSLRYPLIDGHGNFGSIDGDPPAAMRYTEAKLQALAVRFLTEIRQETVDFRPNFDGSFDEPIVLPAQIPNLLVNGATGIAVGMATNIPPHNLGEVTDACLELIDNPGTSVADLMQHVKGPDFPTGARILNTPEELLQIYENGEGPVIMRGEYRLGRLDSGKRGIIIHSIPHGINKSDLIEKIADEIRSERIPQLLDVRDESTEEIRVVLEMKRGTDPEKAMAYLFKRTPLRMRFHVNMTTLVPTDRPDVAVPEKVDLRQALQAFLQFRFEVVTRRLEHELEQLEKRIHILRGFAIVFDGLDEAIKIIRASQDKTDAAQRLMHRFELDHLQADAVLETKLYRLSHLEIDDIRKELAQKEERANEIRKLLKGKEARWKLVRSDLEEVRKAEADERRSAIAGPDEDHEYTAEDYIIREDVYVMVSRDGWIKRQRTYSDLQSIRVREGDEIGWVLGGSTASSVGVFTNFGRCYTIRIDELSSTTGHGVPVQKLFDFRDKESVVGVVTFDERALPKPVLEDDPEPELFGENDDVPEGPYGAAVSRRGNAIRFQLETYEEPSKRTGRIYMNLAKGDEVLRVEMAGGSENVCLASWEGRALIFPVSQIPVFKGSGKGVIAMRLDKADRLIGFTLSGAARQGLEVETTRGRTEIVRTTKFEASNRGNKGRLIIQRGSLKRVMLHPVEVRINGD